jgi:glycosyltransferase involved in cell wall biosynthesis
MTTPARGVNLVGFFSAEFGQGEVARRLDRALRHARIPHTTIPYEQVPHRQEHAFEHSAGKLHDVNILCLNAEHVLGFAAGPGRALLDGRYTIGVWFWETSRFPGYLRPAIKLVDEIWVASDFVRDAISAETLVPVETFPLPVEVDQPSHLTRTDLALPEDRFLFSFVFDFYSTVARKNPDGLIQTYRRAFGAADGAALAVKSINGDRFPDELGRLRELAAGREDIRVVDAFVPAGHARAYTALADCAVSLHRSEGFGLMLAEAMAYGKPAIATAYSGNLTFMDESNSFLVPAETTILTEEVTPYPAGSVWGDPNLDEAARLMREVVASPERAREVGERGRRTIADRHSLERTAEFLRERLGAIGGRPPTTPAREATAFLVQGPRLAWDRPTRLGRGGLVLRRLLRRALRPYTARQNEFEHVVVDALRELELGVDDLRRRLDELERQRGT